MASRRYVFHLLPAQIFRVRSEKDGRDIQGTHIRSTFVYVRQNTHAPRKRVRRSSGLAIRHIRSLPWKKCLSKTSMEDTKLASSMEVTIAPWSLNDDVASMEEASVFLGW